MPAALRFVLILILMLAAFPLAAWFAAGGPRAERSEAHYMWAIDDARDTRLARGEDADLRFVLIGGSSLGWGFSAEQLEGELQVPVVNLGLHGGLGYEWPFDLYADRLDPARDVLVVSPEYELIRINQPVPAALCDYYFVTRSLSREALLCGLRNARARLTDTLLSAIGSTRFDEVYNRHGFNSWGDYTTFYDADAGVLEPPGRPLSLETDAKDIDSYADFLQSLVDRGFNVIYQPVTVAQMACDGLEPDLQLALHQRLAGPAFSRFDADHLFCAPDDLFYNTVYHPLRPIVEAKTDALADTVHAWMAQAR